MYVWVCGDMQAGKDRTWIALWGKDKRARGKVKQKRRVRWGNGEMGDIQYCRWVGGVLGGLYSSYRFASHHYMKREGKAKGRGNGWCVGVPSLSRYRISVLYWSKRRVYAFGSWHEEGELAN